ncbi:MAG: hypothetical protein R3C68_15570 [Myxococcota bacterium]
MSQTMSANRSNALNGLNVNLDYNGNGMADAEDLASYALLHATSAMKYEARDGKRELATSDGMPDSIAQAKTRRGLIEQAMDPELPLDALTRPQWEEVSLTSLFAQRLLRVTGYLWASDNPVDPNSGPRFSGPRVDEIDHLDLRPFHAADIQPIFVTDLDNTAWKGDVTEVFLAAMLVNNRALPAAKAPLEKILRAAIPSPKDTKRLDLLTRVVLGGGGVGKTASSQPAMIRAHLAGLSAKELSALCRILMEDQSWQTLPDGKPWLGGKQRFMIAAAMTAGYHLAKLDDFTQEIFEKGVPQLNIAPFKTNIYRSQQEKYQKLENRGIEGFAITEGFDFLAKTGAEYVGIPPTHVYGSLLDIDDQAVSKGAYLTRLFPVKDKVLLEIMANNDKTLPIAAYGDSTMSDTAMATLVDQVNQMLDPVEPLTGTPTDKTENALAPEFVGKEARETQTKQWVEDFNRQHGTRFEFHPTPQ